MKAPENASPGAAEPLQDGDSVISAIIENTTDSIWAIDRDHEIIFVNQVFKSEFKQSFGVELEPGMSLPDALPEILRPLWLSRYDRALGGERFSFEDGVEVAPGVFVYIQVFMNPIRSGDRVVGAAMFGSNVTGRKQVELALRESTGKLEALFSAMTEMVALHEVVLDGEGRPLNYRILDCNSAYTRVTGIPREAAVGRLADEVYGTPEPPYLAEFSAVALSGEPYHYETYFPPMEKHFSISVVSPGKGRFATITTDITAVKRIQQVIDSKNKELEQIVYATSHDLRSPLVNVDGYGRELEYSIKALSDLLENGDAASSSLGKALKAELPEMTNALRLIRNSTKQMDNLLKGLLRLSRLGRSALNIVAVDMGALMAKTVSALEFQAKTAGAEFRIGDLPRCKGDEIQLTQVFSNLLGNALKFLEPSRPGRVSVSGTVEAGRAVYRVEDNGIGIAPEHQDQIFELFHRLDPARTEGEGLGLTIVRQILWRIDGEIRVESREGEGSCFIVTLPAAPAARGSGP